MATSVGQLTIEMAANIVRLQQDMDKAKSTVQRAMSDIENYVNLAGKAFVALAGVASVGAFAGMIKGAIDSAEKLHDLSISSGASVEALSALAAVGKTTGTSAETIATAMNKLAKNMATATEDSKGAASAIRALGINFDDFQNLSPDQKLVVVAKAMEGFADGSNKSAAAMLLLGRNGAELLPFLRDLALTGELQAKITKAQADAADDFNDNLVKLKASSNSYFKELAMGMIPALRDASEAYLELVNGSGGLREELKKLVADGSIEEWTRMGLIGVSYLSDGFAYLWKTIVTIGKGIGVYAAAFVAAVNGDFRQAGTMLNELGADLNNYWSEETMGSKFRARMEELKNTAKTVKEVKPEIADLGSVSAEAAKKELEAYEKLISGIKEKIALFNAEAIATDKLTEAEKMQIKINADLEAGTLTLTKAHQAELTARLATMKAAEEAVNLAKLEKQILEESAKANYATYESIVKKNKSIEDEVEKQREANILMALGADAVDKLNIEKIREQALNATRKADLAEMMMLDDGVVNGYRDQAKALKALADEKEKAIGVKAAKEAQDAWDKAASSITEGLTDALMRGFESGKGFVDNILSFIKNKFKTTVAEFIIRPIMSPIGNAFASMMPTAAGAASSSGGLFGSILGGASQMGSLFGSGFSGTMGGAGFMDMMGASSSVMANQGMMQGLSMGAGAVMPYVLAATALVSLVKSLDSSGTMHAGGTATASASGARATTGSELNFVVETNQAMQKSIVEMAGGISSTLNGLQRAFGKAEEVVVGLGFADDSSADGAWGALKILASGKTLVDWASGVDRWPGFEFSDGEAGLKEFTDKIATDLRSMINEIGLPEWAQSITDNLQQGATLEQVLETLNQVALIKTQLVEAGNALTLMGGPLAGLAASGESAVLAVANLVGGIDQLVAKAQGFMANYYTENEQAGVLAASLTQSLEKAGFSQAQIAALQTRADFRSLLESIDVNTELGQNQFATLLTVQQQFADLQGYLDTQNTTLQELAKAAPQVALLTLIKDQNATNATTALDVATASAESLTKIDGGVTSMVSAITSLDSTMSNGLSQIADATTSAISIANSAIASANESAARAIEAANMMMAQKNTIAVTQALASGGSYNGGMALVGENGPELIDLNTSGTVYNASQTASMMGGDVAVEIRALREEVAMLRYEARSTAVSTSKMAKLQDNWDVRGLTVKSTTDQPVYTKAV